MNEWHTSAAAWGALIVSLEEETPEMQKKSYCLEISEQETRGGLTFGSPPDTAGFTDGGTLWQLHHEFIMTGDSH